MRRGRNTLFKRPSKRRSAPAHIVLRVRQAPLAPPPIGSQVRIVGLGPRQEYS